MQIVGVLQIDRQYRLQIASFSISVLDIVAHRQLLHFKIADAQGVQTWSQRIMSLKAAKLLQSDLEATPSAGCSSLYPGSRRLRGAVSISCLPTGSPRRVFLIGWKSKKYYGRHEGWQERTERGLQEDHKRIY